MKIGLNAHLLSGRAGYRMAGIHRYIDGLLTHLGGAVPADWSVVGLVGAANPTAYAGVTMRRSKLDTESPLRRIVWEQALQPFAIRDLDLYHAPAFVAPFMMPCPSVVTVHDLSFVHYPAVLSASRRLYLRMFTGVSCKRARRVIAVSHSTSRDVAAVYGIAPDKIDVAGGGYDTHKYRPLPADAVAAFRVAQGLPDRFWLFIGTLEPRKNLVTLLTAYAELAPSERLPLMIGGGKGWLYDDIFAAVERYHLQDWVRFVGFIDDADLPLWYNSAEAFIYPSVYEGFGLPVLEAMACGTPVLVSDVSSLPEVVGDAGLCVSPYDVGAWRAALAQIGADDALRARLSAMGQERATLFTWDATIRATVASYRRALGND